MSLCDDIRTPLRRPCLLRAVQETNVDDSYGKFAPTVGSHVPYAHSEGVTTGNMGAPDSRSITLDMPAHLSPRCSGLHKRGFGTPSSPEKDSNQEHLKALQGLGMDNFSDIEKVQNWRPHDESAERRRRTRVEDLQSMPTSGFGADIDFFRRRRNEDGASFQNRLRTASRWEEKNGLDCTSIAHQFRRRHFSAPPRSSSPWEKKGEEGFEHVLEAEKYADLIGRPEGTGKNLSLKRSKSCRQRRPFHVDRGLKDSIFSSPPVSPRLAEPYKLEGSRDYRYAPDGHEFERLVDVLEPIAAAESPAQSVALIAALREATRNTPAKVVWDSMLTALEECPDMVSAKESQEVALPAGDEPPANLSVKVASVIAAVTDGSCTSPRGNRVGSPMKNRSIACFEDSPKRSPRNGSPSRYSPSVASLSTAADTGVGSSSVGSGGSSPSARQRARRTLDCRAADYTREEQVKARRRRAWVA